MLAVLAARPLGQRSRRHAALTFSVGQVLRFGVEPVGYNGTIYLQRNGVDIPGAVSASQSAFIDYTLTADDAGAELKIRVENLTLDTTAPRLHAAQILVATPDEVLLTYNKPLLTTNTISAAQYAIAGDVATAKTVLSATVADDNTIKVKVSSNFVPGDKPTIAYTQSATDSQRAKDYASNLVPSFSAISVANGFPVPASAASLISTMTICTTGGGGFVFSGSGSSSQCHVLTQAPFELDNRAELLTSGWVEMQVTDSNAATRSIALMQTAGQTLNEMDHSVRVTSGTARAFENSTAVGSLFTFNTPSSLCRVRVYRDMPSGEIHFDTSEDGAITWTRRHTFTTVSNPETEMYAWLNNPSTTVAAIGVALQGFSDRGF